MLERLVMDTSEMDISVQGDSDTGLVREHNEDSYLCLDLSGDDVGIDAVMVVADGMGLLKKDIANGHYRQKNQNPSPPRDVA